MVDSSTGVPHTQHTAFPVPCMVADINEWELTSGAGLSSIAPTVLQLMGIQQPECMPSESLLVASIAIAS